MADHDHMVKIAAQAAARLQRVAIRLREDYPDPTVVTQEEAAQHLAKTGHLYDDNCNEPFCNKWRNIVAGAMQQVAAEQASQGAQ